VVGLGADWFMTIGENAVAPARKLLAHPLDGDPAIASGPSGCSGMAALTRVCTDRKAFKAIGLDRGARVLLINSEGNLGEGSA
jgi:diaminopropionate ammonia-lyase